MPTNVWACDARSASKLDQLSTLAFTAATSAGAEV